MKKTPKIVLILSSAAIALAVAALVTTGASAFPPHPGPGAHLESRIERLDLPEDTRAAVYAILDASRDEQRDLRAAAREAHEEMRDLLSVDAPDEGVVLAQADVISDAVTALRKSTLRTMLAVRRQLTPEQLEGFRDLMRHAGPGHHGAHPGAGHARPCGK